MGNWTKEPWRNERGFGWIRGAHDPKILREPSVCRSPDPLSIDDDNFDRIVACVNAMQGIADPEAFVDLATTLRNQLWLACHRGLRTKQALEVIAEFDQAIAAKGNMNNG